MLKQKQRNLYDCCLAATASLMNVIYEDVFDAKFVEYIETRKGTYGTDIAKAFSLAGLKEDNYYHVINYLGAAEDNSYYGCALPRTFRQLLWGRRALLQMPSLNNEGKSHLIAWNYDEVWDPSNLKTYTNGMIDSVCPEHLWLINENPNPKRSTP